MRSLQPPRLRTVEAEDHRTATWLELFYDLAFVATVATLGIRLGGVHDAGGVFVYLGYLLLVWWLWAGHTFYADRYDTDDLVYRILATVQLVAVAIIATSLTGDAESTLAFAIGYTLARAALLAMYLRARVHVPRTRTLVTGYLIGHGFAAAIWAVSIFTPEPVRFILWAIAFTVDILTPWVMRREQAKVPLDVSHLPERFGLFTILILGESIVATVAGLSHVHWDDIAIYTGVMALVVATTMWWLYFDNVEGMVVRRDPNQKRNWRPTVWIYSHYGISAGLGITAIGLEHSINEAGHVFDSFERWLLVTGASLAVTSLALTHLASGSVKTYRLHNIVAFTRFVAAAAILGLGLFSSMSSQGLVTAIAAVLIVTAMSGVRAEE